MPAPNLNVSTNPRPQNEPAVVVDPNDSNRVVVGANDYRGGDSAIWVYYSGDGGATFGQVEIVDPDSARHFNIPADVRAVRGDPSLAFDRAGNLYAGFIAFARDDDNVGGLFVAKSTDGGKTWPRLTMLQANNGLEISDKPYLAVDTTDGAGGGNVYLSWTKFTGAASRIFLSRSTDGGASFSTGGPLSPCPGHGSVPGVGPQGELSVVWQEFASSGGCTSRIQGATSTDLGKTFSSQFTVGPLDEISDPLPHTSARSNSFPSLAVDRNTGTRYVAWADEAGGNADILLARSVASSCTKRCKPMKKPKKGNTAGPIAFSSPIRVNDDATDHAQFFPWVAVAANGNVGVLFMDRRDDPADFLMNAYLAVSTNGGQSFQPNVRLSDTPSNPNIGFNGTFVGDYINLAAQGDGFRAVWTDTRTGDQEIFSARTGAEGGSTRPNPSNRSR